MKKVMVFGIFDGEHKDHAAFLDEAKSHGDDLIAVVAQDHVIQHLYNKEPLMNFSQRFDELKELDKIGEVVIGDADSSITRIVEQHHPEVVAFAKDQVLLHEEFEKTKDTLSYNPEIVMLKNFEVNPTHD